MTDVAPGWMANLKTEFSRAKLRDKRLLARLETTMECLCAKPDQSFPDAMVSAKRLKGFYRLVRNLSVDYRQVLQAHLDNTAERARLVETPLALHDTTKAKPSRATVEEVGELNTGAAGFSVHVSLIVNGAEAGCPLGVGALQTCHLDKDRVRHALSGADCAKLESKWFDRWLRGVEEVEFLLGPWVRPIHVMDREADCFELFASLIARSSRFVIRGDDRVCWVQDQKTRIIPVLAAKSVAVDREVQLPPRKSSTTAPRSVRNERAARLAKLDVSGCQIELKRPSYLQDPVAPKLSVNVVRVFESKPPQGEDPIEWLLFTNEPIDTAEQMLAIVDIYRRRWVIEEFFKAIKTGCLYEERQLQDRDALLFALVLFLPVACQLLWLRSCSRTQPDAPAEDLLNDVQMKVLRHFASRKLPPSPTVRQLIWSLASLGGHIKNNGEPGWQVLGRSLKRLLELELGWRAATQDSS
jgi:Transposase DNA-binding/Transposase DDE domain